VADGVGRHKPLQCAHPALHRAGLSLFGSRLGPGVRGSAVSSYEIVPCRSDDDLRAYIDEHWRPGHVLARDRRMFDFQYRTPWVDRDRFPGGTSVLCAYRRADQRLAGFLGAIVAPYPRPQSYWLALWHVLPELKGTGEGGRLLQRMQAMALDGGSWIGTFGAGPQALPVYLRRGYAVRAVRRWIFSPGDPGDIMNGVPAVSSSLHSSEVLASEHWFAYRYERHPVFRYKRLAGAVFRSEVNAWGVATHVVALSSGGQSECDAVVGVYEQTSCRARELGRALPDGRVGLRAAWSELVAGF
jgi:Acetyltransferase (GNAT) family